jgi:hypothetical protein
MGSRRSAADMTSDRTENSDLASLHGSVLKRVEGAVRHLVEIAPREHLYEALSTQTPMDALIHLVSREAAAVEVASSVQDPLRAAKARAARTMSDLLSSEGGTLGVEEVAKRLRITRAAVDKRRRAGTLIGIDDGGRAVLYPAWQFTPTGLLPGLDDALRAIGVADPWMRIQFFLANEPDLAARPVDALRQGRKVEVVQAAKRFGRYGDDGP